MASFDDVLTNNGVDTDVIAYIKARGIRSLPLLARAGGPTMDAEAFKAQIITPYCTGWSDKDGFDHKLRDSADGTMVEAAPIVSYEDACMARSEQLSNSMSSQALGTQSLADAQAKLHAQASIAPGPRR